MSTAPRCRRPLIPAVVAFALAAAITGCGSTVATHTDATGLANAGTTGDGLGEAGQPPPGAGANAGTTTSGVIQSGTTTGGGAGGTSTSGAVPGATAATSGNATTGGGSTPVASAAAGPGITRDKIYLGAPYFPDAAKGNTAIGAKGANSGDQRDYYNAVIGDLNKHGGILGRKVVPIYFAYQSASSEPVDSQSQRACDLWTKDNKVFAILYGGPVLQQCAKKAGTLITDADGEAGPTFAALPNLISPVAVRTERLGEATVNGLSRQQYFKPTTDWPTGKVGVITWDNASYRYGIDHGYTPALRRLGITAETSYVAVPQTLTSASDSGAAVSNAVLKFRSDGIDHVLIQDGPAGVFGLGGLTLLFLNNAKSQHYYPRYGFNANNVPAFSVYPADEEHGMLAVDYADYVPTMDDGIKPNPARVRCFRIMQQYGVATTDQSSDSTAAGICDSVWFIETLLQRASTPTLRGAIAAADGLGTSFAASFIYGTRLGAGRHDGGELARNERFDDSCTCMRYTSSPYAP